MNQRVQDTVTNARQRFGSGTVISDGRQVNDTNDISITNPEDYKDKSKNPYIPYHEVKLMICT